MNILKKKKGDSTPVTKRDYTHEMNLFILGSTESGKTTTWRQLQLIGEDSFPEDKKYFQKVIYGNTITSINKLLEIAEKHELEISDENKDKLHSVKKIPLVERTERVTVTPASMSEFKLPRFPLRLVYDLKCIWEDDAIQSAYQITLTNPEYHTPGRLQYYMENIFRILSPDFRPTDVDMLSAYDKTDAEQTSEIYYRKIKINSCCYPAPVCDNKKWDSLEEATAEVIVYTINLTIDALTDFFTTKQFKACSHMIVILNCLDLFMEKTATIDLKSCFCDYADGLNPEKALAYVNNVLAEKVADKGKPVKVIAISVLEKESLSTPFDEVIDLLLPNLPLASACATFAGTPPSIPIQNGTHNGGDKGEEKVQKLAVAPERKDTGTSDKPPPTERERKESVEKAPSGAAENKEGKKKKGKRLVSVESGFESVQNRRKTMEDQHIIMDNFRTTFPCSTVPEEEQCLYYGVYDGHGGGDTSKIVEADLHKNILTDPSFAAGDYQQAIKNGFLTTDTFILTQPSKSGSTAVIAMVVGNQLFVANAGDSECVLCKQIGSGKKAKIEHTVMSYKHVPTDENEKQRISAAGGLVVFGRLFGSLAVSRSFGDRDYKDGGNHFVSAVPNITQVEITPEDQFVVMACDGLWDKLSYEDVVGIVCRLRKESKNATEICKALVQEAINKESMDNITVVLVFFTWKK